MRAFTDFVGMIFLRDGHYKWFHFPPNHKSDYYQYRGHKYHLDTSWAHDVSGYYPWIQYHWWDPTAIVRFVMRWSGTRVGQLKFTEPQEKLADGIVEPEHISTSSVGEPDGKLSPRGVKTQLESMVWERHEKSRKLGSSLSSRTIMYIIVVIIIVLAAGYFTGFIQIGRGG